MTNYPAQSLYATSRPNHQVQGWYRLSYQLPRRHRHFLLVVGTLSLGSDSLCGWCRSLSTNSQWLHWHQRRRREGLPRWSPEDHTKYWCGGWFCVYSWWSSAERTIAQHGWWRMVDWTQAHTVRECLATCASQGMCAAFTRSYDRFLCLLGGTSWHILQPLPPHLEACLGHTTS